MQSLSPTASSIFLSAEGGNHHWRLMEKLAAIFEVYTNPRRDIFAFSTAYIPDCICSSEQVDVALSYVPDPARLISFTEVRDRNVNVGRGYIQHVMGKRKALGVDGCCVVSTRGFASNALRLAEHEGIRVRTIKSAEQTQSEFFRLKEFVVRRAAPDIVSCQVAVSDGERTGTFTASPAEVLQRNLLIVTPERRLELPLVFILNKMLSAGGWQQLSEANGGPTSLGFKPAEPGLRLQYTEQATGLPREIDVVAVVFAVQARVGEVRLPRGSTYHYSDALSQELLAEAVLFQDSQERSAVCMVRALGANKAGAIMFLSERELCGLVNGGNQGAW
jgi:hypothetical protein